MPRGKPTAADRRRQLSRLIEAMDRLVTEEKSYGKKPSADDVPGEDAAKKNAAEAALVFVDASGREVKRNLSVEATHHTPHEDAIWFIDAGRLYLSGKAPSLESALGLKQRGKPFNPAKSKNLALAEKAFRLRYFDKLTWDEVVARIDPSQPDSVDERALTKLITSHWSAICRNIAEEIVGRRRRSDPTRQSSKNRRRSGPDRK
jgi:hypothetical protein